MTALEVQRLAGRNGVMMTTDVLGFGNGVRVTASVGGFTKWAEHIDPDRALLAALEALAWAHADAVPTSRILDHPMGWAFSVFNEYGAFPVAEETA